MSSLGNKIYRKAQSLGNKLSSQSRVLGEKANQALRIADVGLRKTDNTLKNVIVPASQLLSVASGNPQFGMLGTGVGMVANAGISNLRNKIGQVRPYTEALEKDNVRKKFDEAVKNNLSQQAFI
jgi:hypothetical protein